MAYAVTKDAAAWQLNMMAGSKRSTCLPHHENLYPANTAPQAPRTVNIASTEPLYRF